MSLTLTQILGEAGARLGIDTSSGSEGATSLTIMANHAARRVWTAHEWYERRGEVTIFTVAPYDEGTADFTNASTAISGTGTTWAAGFSDRKIALSIGSPWYRFTRTGNTTGTIPTGGYAEATALLSDYVIYQDEYDTAAALERPASVSIYRPEFGGRFLPLSEAGFDGALWVPGQSGPPTHYSLTNSVTAGTRRIKVWPVPDAVYRIRVRYWKAYTDMTSGSNTTGLSDNLERIFLWALCLEGQSLSDARIVTSEEKVDRMIEKAWREQQDTPTTTYRKARIDSQWADDGLWLDASAPFG